MIPQQELEAFREIMASYGVSEMCDACLIRNCAWLLGMSPKEIDKYADDPRHASIETSMFLAVLRALFNASGLPSLHSFCEYLGANPDDAKMVKTETLSILEQLSGISGDRTEKFNWN